MRRGEGSRSTSWRPPNKPLQLTIPPQGLRVESRRRLGGGLAAERQIVSHMFVEKVFPQVVAARALLPERIAAEAASHAIPEQFVNVLLSIIPAEMKDCGCFLDRLTNLWRYEYGLPFTLGEDQLLWGTHMWQPVRHLFLVLLCVLAHIPEPKRGAYLLRLANFEKHEDTLAECLPAIRVPPGTMAEFEVKTGLGDRDVDWCITANGRAPVLVEVKKRHRDLLEALQRHEAGERDPQGGFPPPNHEVGLLFRSVENKFPATNPDSQLQGVWILTGLQQERTELVTAFDALDHAKVHFAVLGDWDRGISVLARRSSDRQVLLDLFREKETDRFEFVRNG